jgi:hypothetical protein
MLNIILLGQLSFKISTKLVEIQRGTRGGGGGGSFFPTDELAIEAAEGIEVTWLVKLFPRELTVEVWGRETAPEEGPISDNCCDSGVNRKATGWRIRGSCSTWTWARLKSKFTGWGPGDATDPVGESTNLVQC